jgi:hypothetical protein
MYTLNSHVACNVGLHVGLNPGWERPAYALYPSPTKFAKKSKTHRRELKMHTYKSTCRLAYSLPTNPGAALYGLCPL